MKSNERNKNNIRQWEWCGERETKQGEEIWKVFLSGGGREGGRGTTPIPTTQAYMRKSVLKDKNPKGCETEKKVEILSLRKTIFLYFIFFCCFCVLIIEKLQKFKHKTFIIQDLVFVTKADRRKGKQKERIKLRSQEKRFEIEIQFFFVVSSLPDLSYSSSYREL